MLQGAVCPQLVDIHPQGLYNRLQTLDPSEASRLRAVVRDLQRARLLKVNVGTLLRVLGLRSNVRSVRRTGDLVLRGGSRAWLL